MWHESFGGYPPMSSWLSFILNWSESKKTLGTETWTSDKEFGKLMPNGQNTCI
jgi:hypothetical protein